MNNLKRFLNKEILFCDISPTCYAISIQKEILKRNIKNKKEHLSYAQHQVKEKLSYCIYKVDSQLIKTGHGIDPTLQKNKAVNISLASKKLNGLLIYPGETFSFWHVVGKISKKAGYKEGRVIVGDKIESGMGGGLCNLANTIHRLVLHSPLEITECHYHSDALALDHHRIPMATGTSISYNYMDYRFKNTTPYIIQLCIWCDDEKLYGELRSEHAFPWEYHLIEENYHFVKADDKYYQKSKIYREIFDKKTGKKIDCQLIRDNCSEVMFDYHDIPEELIR